MHRVCIYNACIGAHLLNKHTEPLIEQMCVFKDISVYVCVRTWQAAIGCLSAITTPQVTLWQQTMKTTIQQRYKYDKNGKIPAWISTVGRFLNAQFSKN